MLSGPEVFTPIFLQFLPKTRLAKYHHSFLLSPNRHNVSGFGEVNFEPHDISHEISTSGGEK